MAVVEVKRGNSPVILGFPHTGTDVPAAVWDRLNDNGRILADTDWHIHQLYDGLLPEVTVVRATFHRYVIDANRDPEGVSLQAFHAPYHAALAAEIERVKAIHGVVVLYDCHSIRSHIPFLFEGKLADLNIGTDMGKTCAPEIEKATAEIAVAAEGYSSILNGRFKGGWTTRHYGRPETGVHAIQMELAQSTHLAAEEPPFALDATRSALLRKPLGAILNRIETIAFDLKTLTGSEA